MTELIVRHQVSLKWAMTLMFLGSAVTLSANVDFSKLGFITFLLAHIVGIAVFGATRDRPMFFHSLGFMFIDLFGIYRWFFS